MKNIFFLPHWYLEKKLSKRNRIIKFCFIFIFIADLVLLDVSIFTLNKIKSLQNDIKEESISKDNQYLKKNQIGNDKTLHSLSALIKSINSGIDFKYINIENNNVDVLINNTNFDYALFIKEIEKENMFTIKSLSLSEEKDNQEVKINLELKQKSN